MVKDVNDNHGFELEVFGVHRYRYQGVFQDR